MEDIEKSVEEKSIEDEFAAMSDDELLELMSGTNVNKESEPETENPQAGDAYISDGEDKDDAFGEVQVDTRTDEEIAEEDKKLKAQSYKIAANLGNFGMFLIIALIFGYVIGRWMDGFFGTKPVFEVFWICCAVAASILELVKNIKKAQKLSDK